MAVLLCLVSFMLNVVVYVECRKQTHDAECHYAECHYAECRGAQEITQNLFGSSFFKFLYSLSKFLTSQIFESKPEPC
jgi:hypothetical protein